VNGRHTGALGRLGVVLLAALPLLAGSASAGPPGIWTQVTSNTDRNVDEVASARTLDGLLHVVWLRRNGAKAELWHTVVSPRGNRLGEPTAIVTGWASVANPDLVRTTDGGLRVFFGGIRSHAAAERNDALNTATAPASGATWTLQGGRAAQDPGAYTSPVGAGIGADGIPISSWATPSGTRVHFGTDPTVADVTVQKACCGSLPDVAVDAVTGQATVGWWSNAPGEAGLYVQDVSAAALVGTKRFVPESATVDKKGAVPVEQRFGIAARAGGGLYVGYGAGHPTPRTVNLWKVGAAAPVLRIRAERARHVNIAAGPEGRLWLMWDRNGRLVFTRTNKAATKVGPLVTVATPGGSSSIWKLNGEGSPGPLDAFVAVTTGGGLSTWHRQVLPKLTIAATGGAIVRFRVTDAGDPVAGATVRVGSKWLATNAAGRASIDLPAGRVRATASKAGYSPATTSTVSR
jgi:hypothetical protein